MKSYLYVRACVVLSLIKSNHSSFIKPTVYSLYSYRTLGFLDLHIDLCYMFNNNGDEFLHH